MGERRARRIGTRRWLNGRSAAGLVLFTVSLLSGRAYLAEADVSIAYWAAARDLGTGTVLRRADLHTVSLSLPPGTAAAYLPARTALAGVLVRAVSAGDLVPASALASGPEGGPGRAMAVAVDPEHAVGGALDVGDRVDVYATFRRGAGHPRTTLVARSVEVLGLVVTEGFVGGDGVATGVTVAVTPEEAARLSFAVNVADIDLVRVVRRIRSGSTTVTERDLR